MMCTHSRHIIVVSISTSSCRWWLPKPCIMLECFIRYLTRIFFYIYTDLTPHRTFHLNWRLLIHKPSQTTDAYEIQHWTWFSFESRATSLFSLLCFVLSINNTLDVWLVKIIMCGKHTQPSLSHHQWMLSSSSSKTWW